MKLPARDSGSCPVNRSGLYLAEGNNLNTSDTGVGQSDCSLRGSSDDRNSQGRFRAGSANCGHGQFQPPPILTNAVLLKQSCMFVYAPSVALFAL